MIVLLLGGHSSLKLDGIPLYKSPLFAKLQLRSGDSLKDIIVLPVHEVFNQTSVIQLIEQLDQLPADMLKKIKAADIKIQLFTGKLTDYRHTAHLKGIKPRGYQDSSITWDDVPGIGGGKTVFVKIGYSEKGSGHGSVNLELHELAHSLQHLVYSKQLSTKEYKQIWRTEADKLFPGNFYFFHYQEEYFAEAFAMFYYNDSTKERLKKDAPATFAFISHLD